MDWLNLNGYGVYVWPCYLITAIVLAGNWILARRKHSKLVRRLQQRKSMEKSA